MAMEYFIGDTFPNGAKIIGGIERRGTITGVINNTSHGAQRDRVVKEIVKNLHNIPIAGFGNQHPSQHHLTDEVFGDG